MTRVRLLLGVALLASCAAPPRPQVSVAPPAAPPQSLQTRGTARRVVLQSFDGLGADDVDALHPPALLRIANAGTSARVTPATPSVTSTTHATILTGRAPEEHGVLANYFHKPGTPATESTRGMNAEIMVPTIVDDARAAGKRVGSMLFPTIDGRSQRRTPDFGLYWTDPVVPARVVHLGKTDFHAEWVPPGWGATTPRHPSFSPVMRTRITRDIPQHGIDEFDLAAYDTTDDRVRNYDTFYVEHAGSETPLDAQHWFAVSSRFDDGTYGAWSKLLTFDPALTDVTLYLGGIHRAEGTPAEFVRMVDDAVGFWPGKADEHLVDDATYAEQNHRFSDYLTRATTFAAGRMPFDLLLAYQPVVDAAEHHLRGVDEPVIHAAIADVDRAAGALMETLDPARDALVVVGDHGLAHVDTAVHLQTILNTHGFAQWTAMTSGNVAMLSGGDAGAAQTLVLFLTALTAPDGAKVFEDVRIINGSDVRAIAFPRFFVTSREEGTAFAKPPAPGEHGGLSTHHEYDTVLFAWGAGVMHAMLPRIAQTEIAGFVRALMGIGAR